MNDYRYIYKKPFVRLTTDDVNIEFRKNKAFLEKAVQESKNEGYWPVVLTHHMPWIEGTSHPRYKGNPENVAFATNLSASKDMVQLWVAGHTHYNCRHSLAGYDLISNQRGYAPEIVKDYNKSLSILLK